MTQPSMSPTTSPSSGPTSITTISGTFYTDQNNNRIIDTGEGIENRKVELVSIGVTSNVVQGERLLEDVIVQETITDEDGGYAFVVTSSDNGIYKVRFNLDVDSSEPECCSPSRPGPESDIISGQQCASYYETDVIEVVDGGPTKYRVDGGMVCGHCPLDWDILVNNGYPVPDDDGFDGKNFSSYNAASVNTDGFAVFRARSTGGNNPSTGIFIRDMLDDAGSIVRQAGRRTRVPPPNNLETDFIEFPSFPRMSIYKYHIATRGNHGPVWEYELEDGSETRIGNTDLYVNLRSKLDTEVGNDTNDTSPNLFTGMAKLGSVPEFPIFQVPGLEPQYDGTVFDVFPGSPSIDNFERLAFKGNYAKDDVSQTGVFYRHVDPRSSDDQIYVVANSETEIPIPNDKCQTVTFGSTSPPSIANNKMIFLGLDIEESPKCGGIYEAELDSSNFPTLNSLVNFETVVPGEDEEDTIFTAFGEGLSYDGNAVSFWGGWGDELEVISLCCPTSGNKAWIAYCLNNDTNTQCDQYAPDGCDSTCYQNKTVPVHQGIFVYNEGRITAAAKGSTADGTDFIFWNYSGKPPNTGPDEDSHSQRRRLDTDANETDAAEPPRWRASATSALSQYDRIAYKMKQDDVVGIYQWYEEEGTKLKKSRCRDWSGLYYL